MRGLSKQLFPTIIIFIHNGSETTTRHAVNVLHGIDDRRYILVADILHGDINIRVSIGS